MKSILLASAFGLLAFQSNAQTLIFEEKFDVSDNLRHESPYAAKGNNAFIYADPNLTYPGGTYDADYSRFIENNHYAIVRPGQIYNSVNPATLWMSNINNAYLLWSTRGAQSIVNYNADGDGNPNGGVMVVNAGRTPGVLYQRPSIQLEYGKYYKLSYKIWIEHPNVRLKVNFLDKDGITGLGFQLGTIHTSQSNPTTGYFTEDFYFYLPTSTCSEDHYTINIQNHNLNNSNLDFVIDNIKLEELNTAPALVTIDTIQPQCLIDIIPVLTNDYANGFTVGNTASINPLNNDDIDGNNTSATATNATFNFEVPLGAYREDIWSGPTVVVPGEGTWSYNTNNGLVNFIPLVNFKGNPTPINYTLTNSDNVTSNIATIMLEYNVATSPKTANDTTKIQLGTGPYETALSIFDNDFTGGNLTPTPQNANNVYFKNPHTGTVFPANFNGGIYVSGEGTWTYNETTGKAIFTPLSGFTSLPSPLPYSYQESSNQANWSLIIFEDDAPLPISLISFDGKQQENSIVLTWKTAAEYNNAYFEVERNNNNQGWNTIAKIESKAKFGNSNTTLVYNSIDNENLNGSILYRLKQVDFDGKSNYSKVIYFNINNNTVSIYPNPAANNITVSLNQLSNYAVLVYDNLGALVYNKEIINNNTHSIATTDLANGVYFVQILVDNTVLKVEKVIIQK